MPYFYQCKVITSYVENLIVEQHYKEALEIIVENYDIALNVAKEYEKRIHSIGLIDFIDIVMMIKEMFFIQLKD